MEAKPWENSHRLSPHVRPQQYFINLYPNLKQGSFVGSVDILIVLLTAQSYIKLHSKGLSIKETKLNSRHITAFSYPDHEFWVVVPNGELRAGEYKLQITFEGSLLNKMFGFYRSAYTNTISQGQHYIAVSKFEPADARSAFPCFDEPELKSKFQISLTRPSGENYIALSNMNQESEELNIPAFGLTTVHFANSVPMSTYLTDFIVCDFQSIEPVKADQGFPLTAYARHGQVQNMYYAQRLALMIINFYVNYFGIQYALPKLDIIAIPEFVNRAAEHWGTVVFRERSVFFNEQISSCYNQLHVALTVAHELAHMWIGNFVTVKWWNDLWLNEAFATYMKYKALEDVYPGWEVDSLFLINCLQSIQHLDATLSTHALIKENAHPDQLNELFDVISYKKGSSVIRMLEEMLGEDVFRNGVSAYLKRFAFNNAETDDLWAELQNAAQNTVDVKKVMDTWTRQAGFPVVTAIRNRTKLTLEQERFILNPDAEFSPNSGSYNFSWDIPITYTTSNSDTVHKFWFTSDMDMVTIDIPDAQWIKLNNRHVGYYIVNYSVKDWCLLITTLENNIHALSAADRSNLIHDAFSLAKANYLSYDIAMDTIKRLSLEHHYVPWDVAATNLITLRHNLYQRATQTKLDTYVHYLLGSISEDFWIESTRNFLQRKHRAVILHLGCFYSFPSYQTKAYKLFKQFLYNQLQLHPDIRYIVYYYGIAQGTVGEWNRMWSLYLHEHEPQEKIKLLMALTASKELPILTKLLQYAKIESYVRSQDFLKVLSEISHNPVGTQLVWDFLRNEWQYLVNRFSIHDPKFGKLIPKVCSHFNTQEHLNEMLVFFDKYPEAGAGKAGRKIALEIVANNIKWLENHEAVIYNWLAINIDSNLNI